MSYFPAEMVTSAAQTWHGVKTFAAGIILATATSLSMVQGGSIPTPTDEVMLSLRPRDPANAPFLLYASGATFNATFDNTFGIGIAPDTNNPRVTPRAYLQWENDYDDGSGHHKMEFHADFCQGDNTLSVRPFFTNYNRDTGQANFILGCRDGASGGTINGQEASTGDLLFSFTRNAQYRFINGVQVEQLDGVNGLWLNGGANALSIGPAPAPSGRIRLSNGDGMTSMNAAVNHTTYLTWLNADELTFGHSAAGYSPLTMAFYTGAGSTLFGVIGTTGLTMASGQSLLQTQGGSTVAPSTEFFIILQPRSTTDGFAKASYAGSQYSALFNTTFDELLDIGYNLTSANPTLPSARWSIESDYEDSPGLHLMEMHGQYSSLAGGAGTTFRWLTGSFRGYSTFRGTSGLFWRDGSGGDTGYTAFQESTSGTIALKLETAGITAVTKAVSITGTGTWLLSGATALTDVPPNDMLLSPQAAFVTATGGNRKSANLDVVLSAPTNSGTTEAEVRMRRGADDFCVIRADGLFNLQDLTHTNFFQVYNDGNTHIDIGKGTLYISNPARASQLVCADLYQLASSSILQWTPIIHIADAGGTDYAVFSAASASFQIGAAVDFGGGVGVFGMHNATAVPTTNATNGVIVYAESGAAKVRGASGTITTFGPADPHCPRCGLDFAVQWVSPEGYGRAPGEEEQLAVCFACLTKKLHEHGIDVGDFTIHHKLAS